MNEIQNAFVENLKFYRSKKNLSQGNLAELCDCAISTIGCIESGKMLPSFETICRISKALDIHPADLFLRNASTTVNNTKNLLRSKLIPQIEEFIDKDL